MLARVFSCAIISLKGVVVEVTVGGLPAIIIIGLPDTLVQEIREGVQMAIKYTSLIFPRKRITVNLAPTAVPKRRPSYYLPIAGWRARKTINASSCRTAMPAKLL